MYFNSVYSQNQTQQHQQQAPQAGVQNPSDMRRHNLAEGVHPPSPSAPAAGAFDNQQTIPASNPVTITAPLGQNQPTPDGPPQIYPVADNPPLQASNTPAEPAGSIREPHQQPQEQQRKEKQQTQTDPANGSAHEASQQGQADANAPRNGTDPNQPQQNVEEDKAVAQQLAQQQRGKADSQMREGERERSRGPGNEGRGMKRPGEEDEMAGNAQRLQAATSDANTLASGNEVDRNAQGGLRQMAQEGEQVGQEAPEQYQQQKMQAERLMQQGIRDIQQGQQKEQRGGQQIAAGVAQTAMGGAQIAKGTALMSNPFTMAAGMALIAQGTQNVAQGTQQITQGTQLQQQGREQGRKGQGEIRTSRELDQNSRQLALGVGTMADSIQAAVDNARGGGSGGGGISFSGIGDNSGIRPGGGIIGNSMGGAPTTGLLSLA